MGLMELGQADDIESGTFGLQHFGTQFLPQLVEVDADGLDGQDHTELHQPTDSVSFVARCAEIGDPAWVPAR